MRALAAALCLFAAPAFAQGGDILSPEIGLFEAGVLCAAEPVATQPAPDTIAGFINVIDGDPEFVSHGRLVPAVIGISFGVRSAAVAQEFPVVEIIVTHPPMGPDGVTRQSYLSDIGTTAPSMSFYAFEFDEELVLGDWTFTAMAGEEILWSAGFEVVSPRQISELAGICNYLDLLA